MKGGTNIQQAWRPSVSKGGKSVARGVGRGGASHDMGHDGWLFRCAELTEGFLGDEAPAEH